MKVIKTIARFLGCIAYTVFGVPILACGLVRTVIRWLCVNSVHDCYGSLLEYIRAVHGRIFSAIVYEWKLIMGWHDEGWI